MKARKSKLPLKIKDMTRAQLKEYKRSWVRKNYMKSLVSQKMATMRFRLKQKYNITPEKLKEIVASQNNKCAICGNPETRKCYGATRSLSIDHNHTTGIVRSLLCSGCNWMIGHAKENPSTLRRAAEYLERHNILTIWKR